MAEDWDDDGDFWHRWRVIFSLKNGDSDALLDLNMDIDPAFAGA